MEFREHQFFGGDLFYVFGVGFRGGRSSWIGAETCPSRSPLNLTQCYHAYLRPLGGGFPRISKEIQSRRGSRRRSRTLAARVSGRSHRFRRSIHCSSSSVQVAVIDRAMVVGVGGGSLRPGSQPRINYPLGAIGGHLDPGSKCACGFMEFRPRCEYRLMLGKW